MSLDEHRLIVTPRSNHVPVRGIASDPGMGIDNTMIAQHDPRIYSSPCTQKTIRTYSGIAIESSIRAQNGESAYKGPMADTAIDIQHGPLFQNGIPINNAKRANNNTSV